MRVLSCKYKRNNIIYEVETNKGNIFKKSLPKKVIPSAARKKLQREANKVDKQ